MDKIEGLHCDKKTIGFKSHSTPIILPISIFRNNFNNWLRHANVVKIGCVGMST